jgi:hypothetical protein
VRRWATSMQSNRIWSVSFSLLFHISTNSKSFHFHTNTHKKVQLAAELTMRVRAIVNGQHNRKTASFVRAAVAFMYVCVCVCV